MTIIQLDKYYVFISPIKPCEDRPVVIEREVCVRNIPAAHSKSTSRWVAMAMIIQLVTLSVYKLFSHAPDLPKGPADYHVIAIIISTSLENFLNSTTIL
jgi:hypothetical protein